MSKEASIWRHGTIRGETRMKWERAGRPNWSLDQTIEECINIDKNLETRGTCSAPKFRKARKAGNDEYIKHWVNNSGFCWLTKIK